MFWRLILGRNMARAAYMTDTRSFRFIALARRIKIEEQTMEKHKEMNTEPLPVPGATRLGFDPELLFVECAVCGSPVLWEKGRSTEILRIAGVEPGELDSQCLLITEGCPLCSKHGSYNVRIIRLERGGMNGDFIRTRGTA